MKRILCFILVITSVEVQAQSTLPVVLLKSMDPGKPLIFFISGDGGWKGFAPSLAQTLNHKGYPVIGLDAKSYFWTRKTPEQAAKDISALLLHFLKTSNIKNFVIMGYSFGADVAPFIQSRLHQALASSLMRTVLLSPSPKADFEIHMMEMMGIVRAGGQSVADEIRKLSSPVTLILGKNDDN